MPAEAHRPVPEQKSPLIGPLPRNGPWSAVGLDLRSFLVALGVTLLIYLFFGGSVWAHLGRDDFARIVVSYTVIPPVVLLLLWQRGTLSLANGLAAITLIALIKFVLTAGFELILDV